MHLFAKTVFVGALSFLAVLLLSHKTEAQSTITSFTFQTTLEGKVSVNNTISVTIYKTGQTTPVASKLGTLNSQNNLVISNVSLPLGNYDLVLKSPSYLEKKIVNVSLINSAQYKLSGFLVGDFDNNGSIDLPDWNFMKNELGTANTASDINNDGIVNSIDFSYLNKNWNRATTQEALELLTQPSLNKVPVGSVTGVSTDSFLNGWAQDPDDLNTKVTLRFYLDGELDSGNEIYLDEIIADRSNTQKNGYGFSLPLPTKTLAGTAITIGNHTLYAYARDAQINTFTQIGVPTTVEIKDLNPKGRIGLVNGVLSGWAVDRDVPHEAVIVKIYLDGTNTTGTLLSEITSNVSRAGFLEASGYPGDHGFVYTLPSNLTDGRMHKLYAYVKDTTRGTLYPLLDFPYTFAIGNGVEIGGVEEIIYDKSASACAYNDIPDMPARAIRNNNGEIALFYSNDTTYPSFGYTFQSLTHTCSVALDSPSCTLWKNPLISPNPNTFSGCQYIAAPYTVDGGKTILALLHNEFHAEKSADTSLCPSGNLLKCWYASVTEAFSNDGGHTFSLLGTPPDHLVVASPYKYSATLDTRVGYGMPSNIVKNPNDGYYYSLLQISPYGAQTQGTCIIRSTTPQDPKSWRTWKNGNFNTSFINPYIDVAAVAADHVCDPLLFDNAPRGMVNSLTYNTYLNSFLVVSQSKLPLINPNTGGRTFFPDGSVVFRTGFYYATSPGVGNLTSWSPTKLIAELNVNDPSQDLSRLVDKEITQYPSIIDHDNPQNLTSSNNFEFSDQNAYIYYTRNHGLLDRDQVRIPIHFTP